MVAKRCAVFVALICSALVLMPPVASAGEAEGINLRRTVTVEVVAKTKDAVVNISTTKLVNQRVSPFGGDPFWQDFGQTVRVPANSLGSGFIVHPDGYVVTNNHVIDRAREIHVELADGRKLPATLISTDADADLAILKISSDKPFPVLSLGDSSDLMIGEPTIAIGNPLGFSHSVSTGVVSALHRDLVQNAAPPGRQPGKPTGEAAALQNLIQTDAAINPGNSGGPLLNAYGQVIGINTAIRSDAQNIGFAIPVNRLRELIPLLMNPAQAARVDVPVKLAETRKITPPAKVETEVIFAGEPSHVLKTINGQPVRDIVDAYAMLLQTKPGEQLKLGWSDAGGKSDTQVLTAKAVPLPDAIVQAKKKLGITIEQLTPMLAAKYQLSVEDGMFVQAVANDTVASRAGIQPGDIIVQVGRYRVATLDDLSVLLQHLPETGQVRIGVIRGDDLEFGTLTFGASD